MADKRRELIHEWEVGFGAKAERYRLIAVAESTPGYRDHWLIEQLGQDGLGEPRWTQVHTWQTKDEKQSAKNLLAQALEDLLLKSKPSDRNPGLVPWG